ncbi:MAG: hypothetical protein LBQ73_00405, partial [Tannerellaceae bacterium]|nr:hypothetical protein [Tannerellaceae bacterium]
GYAAPLYLTPQTGQYTSYKYPQAWNDSTVIGVKTSLSDIPSLVSLTNGREKRLAYLGSINGRITLHRNRVYWIEYIPGIRWTHENYTVIKYFDLTNGRVETLTPRRRYISPAPGDSVVAASLFTEEGESRIALIETENGNEYRQYPTPGNVFIKELAQGGKDTLYAVAAGDEGISLLRLDTQAGRWEELLKPTPANITSPVYKDGKLFFESGLNGSNNIYCLDTSSRKAYRLSSARFGAFHPAFFAGREELLFSDYQAKGYRIASLPVDSLIAEEADFAGPARFTLAETLSQQEGSKLNASALKPVDFQPRPYRKASHLFQVHSWAPLYYSVADIVSGGASDFISVVKPGATLISQNALNTAITQAGWYYDKGYHHGKLDFVYMGWYPVIQLNADYGGKAFDVLWKRNEKGELTAVSQPAGRNLLEVQAQAYIPFNLTNNHYIRGIQPSVTYYFTNNAYQQFGKSLMTYFQYIQAEVRFYNYRKMAQRDILPRLGYQFRLHFMNLPFSAANFSNLYAARLTTYWPGIMPNHSLMLRAGYLYQPNDEKPMYIPKQLIEAPRGYDYQYRTSRQAGFKADYAFPIVTPDLRIGSLLYIRRLRANLFYDLTYNQATAASGWTLQRSYGGDLIFDWNAMRFSFPLTTGIRVIRPVESGDTKVEALFSVSF